MRDDFQVSRCLILERGENGGQHEAWRLLHFKSHKNTQRSHSRQLKIYRMMEQDLKRVLNLQKESVQRTVSAETLLSLLLAGKILKQDEVGDFQTVPTEQRIDFLFDKVQSKNNDTVKAFISLLDTHQPQLLARSTRKTEHTRVIAECEYESASFLCWSERGKQTGCQQNRIVLLGLNKLLGLKVKFASVTDSQSFAKCRQCYLLFCDQKQFFQGVFPGVSSLCGMKLWFHTVKVDFCLGHWKMIPIVLEQQMHCTQTEQLSLIGN